ncbi:hypothetical protein [Paraburkholderia caribensis]|uniref:hypothetical protein n=1 Tax=Paraburkholderia caribensis TaxID=75105 RepID=UPI0028555188|nr:hypothetical protein [Paraburkholderia caribensis]MDR6381815.1 hypothetical protein [Paraburkholderia caribensis]
MDSPGLEPGSFIPESAMDEMKSVAHRRDMNHFGQSQYSDGLVPWFDAEAPNLDAGRTTGRLRACGYCGSMHPADVAAAIRAGAKGHWADFKYGWPHKAYFDGIPNPHAGMLESRCSCSHPKQEEVDAGKWVRSPTGMFDQSTGKPTFTWREPGKPAAQTTYGKFYTEHLQDATPEDRATIEQHLGLSFEFSEDGRVSWKPCRA